jgi:hypothetical protein
MFAAGTKLLGPIFCKPAPQSLLSENSLTSENRKENPSILFSLLKELVL